MLAEQVRAPHGIFSDHSGHWAGAIQKLTSVGRSARLRTPAALLARGPSPAWKAEVPAITTSLSAATVQRLLPRSTLWVTCVNTTMAALQTEQQGGYHCCYHINGSRCCHPAMRAEAGSSPESESDMKSPSSAALRATGGAPASLPCKRGHCRSLTSLFMKRVTFNHWPGTYGYACLSTRKFSSVIRYLCPRAAAAADSAYLACFSRYCRPRKASVPSTNSAQIATVAI